MKIKELLSAPEKWTQGAFCKTADGRDCGRVEAVRFCLKGAMQQTCIAPFRQKRTMIYEKMAAVLPEAGGICRIVAWNDAPERTFEEVKELVERLDV